MTNYNKEAEIPKTYQNNNVTTTTRTLYTIKCQSNHRQCKWHLHCMYEHSLSSDLSMHCSNKLMNFVHAVRIHKE